MNPQVAAITKVRSRVAIEVGGRTLKGDEYLIPGFEEIPVVAVPPSGSVANGTKAGWTVYEPKTGRLVYSYPWNRTRPHSALDALEVVAQMFAARGKAQVLAAIEAAGAL